MDQIGRLLTVTDGFFWITNLDATFDEAKHTGSSAITHNGTWQVVAINVAADAQWADTVTRLRYDPTNSSGATIEVDWIRVINTGATMPSSSSPTNEEKSQGPAAYWKFDEGYGQTVQDSSSSKNNGTLGATSGSSTDDPTWQAEDQCISGKCLKFDGGDYINTGVFINTSNNFTLSGWTKVTDKSAQQAFFGVNDNDTNRSYIGLRDGKYWAGVGDTQRYTTSFAILSKH